MLSNSGEPFKTPPFLPLLEFSVANKDPRGRPPGRGVPLEAILADGGVVHRQAEPHVLLARHVRRPGRTPRERWVHNGGENI